MCGTKPAENVSYSGSLVLRPLPQSLPTVPVSNSFHMVSRDLPLETMHGRPLSGYTTRFLLKVTLVQMHHVL